MELGTTKLKLTGGAGASGGAEPAEDVPAADVTAARPVPGRAEPAPTPGDAWLRVVAGNAVGTTISLTEEPFTIGRAEEGTGGLAGDPELSRRHTRVSRVEGRIVVEDLGSTNGTFVNGLRIPAPTVIEPGDVLWIGTTTLTVTTPERPVPDVAPVEPPPPRAESGLIGRFAALSDRNPKRVLTFVGILFLISLPLGGPVATLLGAENAFDDPQAESVKVSDRVADATGEERSPQVIALLRDAPVDSSETRQRVDRIVEEMRKEPLVSRVASFYSTDDQSFVSKDGRSTFVAAFFKSADESELEDAATKINEEISDPPNVRVGGAAVTGTEVAEQVGMDLGKAEGMAFPILFILSLFVFRGVVAALMPLFVGMLTVLTTFLVLRIINEFYALSEFALNVVIALGLGLAIDYSLFVVMRYREELAKIGEGRWRPWRGGHRGHIGGPLGSTPPGARSSTARSRCRSRSPSLALFPQPFLRSMGIGGAVCALVAVAMSLLALPALLAVLGPRINSLAPQRWKQSAQRTARQERRGRLVPALAVRDAQARPRRNGLERAFLILLGIPALGIQFTGFDSRWCRSTSTRAGGRRAHHEFRSNPSPEITVLAQAPRSAEPEVESLVAELRKAPGVNPTRPAASAAARRPVEHHPPADRLRAPGPHGGSRRVRPRAKIPGSPVASRRRYGQLPRPPREHLLPPPGGDPDPLPAHDRRAVPHDRLGRAPAQGRAHELALAHGRVRHPGADIPEGQPRGVARLREPRRGRPDPARPPVRDRLRARHRLCGLPAHTHPRGPRGRRMDRDSVAIGIERTGRIVTQAAMLFCVAIAAFATSSVIFIKEVGVGTAFAVILDATIIRAFLVPSLMALLGARNWWAPGRFAACTRRSASAKAERRSADSTKGLGCRDCTSTQVRPRAGR